MILPTFIFSHQGDWEILILDVEKITDLGVQRLGDGKQGRNRGRNLSIFDLGEKTLGKICSQSQLFKGGGLFQAHRAYSFADILLRRG